jgi:alpha-L-fucosidase
VGANLLLNIGPRPDGTVPPEAEERLRELGKWLEVYGGAIYGTRAGPIAPRSWGVTTQRGDTVFLHVLDWSDPILALPTLGVGTWKARSWPDGSPVHLSVAGDSVTLTLPKGSEAPDRIISLTRR